jgi:hypothetical protein
MLPFASLTRFRLASMSALNSDGSELSTTGNLPLSVMKPESLQGD